LLPNRRHPLAFYFVHRTTPPAWKS
jgi:hypothetical protein